MKHETTLFAAALAGAVAVPAWADVVIKPTAVPTLSTWRSCVPPENTINNAGLSAASNTGDAVPAAGAWPTHVTGGCDNMWHTSCLGQPNGTTCEGGDLAPFIVFDLGAAWDLSAMHLWNHNQVAPAGPSETNRGLREVMVSFSSDGTNFGDAMSISNVLQAPGSAAYQGDGYVLPPVNARYVKIEVLANWGSTAATGMSEVRFIGSRFGIANASVPTPTFENCAASDQTLTANMINGGVPSTNLHVTADLASLSGGTMVAMTGGPTTYTINIHVPAGFAPGTYTIPVRATDDEGHNDLFNATFTVQACIPTLDEAGDAGELPATAQPATGSGELGRIRGGITAGDADMYLIHICSPGNFSATTLGSAVADTQLFLFNAAGMGVAFNDDIPTGQTGDTTLQSRLSSTFVSVEGDYYLAVSAFDRDPLDAGGLPIWIDTAYDIERAPDGTGAAGTVTSWETAPATTGTYAILLTGACYLTPACPADIGVQGGVAGRDGLLDNNDFVVFISYFFGMDTRADIGVQGGVAGHDGLYDNNDFVVYISLFFGGCGA